MSDIITMGERDESLISEEDTESEVKSDSPESLDYLIPDYFLNFKCKMGACRSACCVGWPVSVSMQDYFHLLGIDCRPELRHRLDCGLRVADHPTPEAYARFEPRYDGNCPMRMDDGRCMLHAELGESVLSNVCRLYPRGIRREDGVYECSCANSCEGVLEMFLNRSEPIRFITRKLALTPPPIPERQTVFPTLGLGFEIRNRLIRVIQERSIPLCQRVLTVGSELERIGILVDQGDAEKLKTALSEPIVSSGIPELGREALAESLSIIEKLMEILDSRSNSVYEYGEAVMAYLGNGEEALNRYTEAEARFETEFPQWQLFFEHILVNHMFFSVFPFQDRPEDMRSEVTALCVIYALMRFLAVGYTAEHKGADAFIDVMAAAFRLIDHTDFDRYSVVLLKRIGCISPDKICGLTQL